MDDDALLSEVITLIDSMLSEIGEDYRNVYRAMSFRRELFKYRDRFESLRGSGNRDEVSGTLKTFLTDIQAFNIWMKVHSITTALDKKRF
jgi:hypothetical protein